MSAKLIVAMDVPDLRDIPAIVDRLPPEVDFFKVGLELYTAFGPEALAYLKGKNKNIFLDLKLHDIPQTVASAVKSSARHKVSLLTIHASGGREMLRAAVRAKKEAGSDAPKLLAVTVLTSLSPSALSELGVERAIPEQVLALGRMAIEEGVDGLVCSPLEAQAFRKEFGSAPILVTPGIRPAGSDPGDQKRFATPRDAVVAGADYLVVGRPVLKASDPMRAAHEILAEISSQA